MKNKKPKMTGKIQIRETSSIFGRKKLVLQVEMSGSGFVPEWDTYAGFTWWVDATRSHIRQLPEATLNDALTGAIPF